MIIITMWLPLISDGLAPIIAKLIKEGRVDLNLNHRHPFHSPTIKEENVDFFKFSFLY